MLGPTESLRGTQGWGRGAHVHGGAGGSWGGCSWGFPGRGVEEGTCGGERGCGMPLGGFPKALRERRAQVSMAKGVWLLWESLLHLGEQKASATRDLGSPPGMQGAFSLPVPCLKRGFWPWQNRVVQEPGPTTPPLASPLPLPFHPTGGCVGGGSCGGEQEGMGCPSPQKPDPDSWVKMRSVRSPRAAPHPLIPHSTGVSSKTLREGAGPAASPVPAPRAGRWQQDVAPGSCPGVTPS